MKHIFDSHLESLPDMYFWEQFTIPPFLFDLHSFVHASKSTMNVELMGNVLYRISPFCERHLQMQSSYGHLETSKRTISEGFTTSVGKVNIISTTQ